MKKPSLASLAVLLLVGCGPALRALTCQQVVDAFKGAGLEAESARPMTKDDYGIAPIVAIEGIRFLIPSLCEDCGGRIMSFNSQGDLGKTKTFYDTMGKESAILFLVDVCQG